MKEALCPSCELRVHSRALSWWIAVWLVAGCGAERSVAEPARRALAEPSAVRAPPSPPVARANGEAEGGQICPAEAESARVGTETVKDGAALVFTTSDDVTRLRSRVAVLAVPAPMQSADSRLDNIHKGVRRVFVTEDAAEIASLRRTVDDHARAIAKNCGFGLASPARQSMEPTRLAQPVKPGAPTRAPAKPNETRALQEKSDAAKTDKSAAGKPKSKPKVESKPNPEEKRPAVRKSPNPFMPKENDKPRLPPLPGVRPEPIAP